MIAPFRPNTPEQTDPEYRFVVMLLDGPYDGQDIRVTNAELTQGVIVRSNHMYVRSGFTSTRGITSATMPLFRWLEEAKIVLLPFLTMSYAL
ncbi:MAG TPA: hypothetical protein VF471_03240 [Pseudoxanthomonas sp.]